MSDAEDPLSARPRASGEAPRGPRSSQPAERLAGPGGGARLWLLRHAEVHGDWQGVAYGQLDVPLSEDGRATTRTAGAAFGSVAPARLLSSDLQRAHELALAIHAACGVPIELSQDLREIDRGGWQGRRVEELRTDRADEIELFYADPWNFDGHGGECDARTFARARRVIEPAVAEHPGETLVVCTHYNVLRVLVGRALGIPPARTFALRVDPGRAVLLEDAAAGWVLHRSNVTGPGDSEDPSDPTHPSHRAQQAPRAEAGR